MDEDGNGEIEFQQFLHYMMEYLLIKYSKINTQTLIKDLTEIFRVFDKYNTGYITPIQLRVITSGMID